MSKWVALLLLLAPIASFAACPVSCPTTVPSSVACLSWQAPTTNTDDSALTDLAGFKVYFSLNANFTSGVSSFAINSPTNRCQMFMKLPPGKWYFRMTAFNTAGKESALTAAVSKTIRIAAPTDGAIEAPTDGSIEPR
jgi:hypothetical protein